MNDRVFGIILAVIVTVGVGIVLAKQENIWSPAPASSPTSTGTQTPTQHGKQQSDLTLYVASHTTSSFEVFGFLTAQNHIYIADATVTIINAASGKVYGKPWTNADGYFIFIVNENSTTTVKAEFAGNSQYLPSSGEVTYSPPVTIQD
ncbi:MAG: hypothetical protein ABSG33_00035 [Candidatus Bathyarchaeia archaeon]|jgi:hypothetical protein